MNPARVVSFSTQGYSIVCPRVYIYINPGVIPLSTQGQCLLLPWGYTLFHFLLYINDMGYIFVYIRGYIIISSSQVLYLFLLRVMPMSPGFIYVYPWVLFLSTWGYILVNRGYTTIYPLCLPRELHLCYLVFIPLSTREFYQCLHAPILKI